MVDMSSTLSGLGPMFSSVSSLMMIGVMFLISLILLGVIGGFFYWSNGGSDWRSLLLPRFVEGLCRYHIPMMI